MSVVFQQWPCCGFGARVSARSPVPRRVDHTCSVAPVSTRSSTNSLFRKLLSYGPDFSDYRPGRLRGNVGAAGRHTSPWRMSGIIIDAMHQHSVEQKPVFGKSGRSRTLVRFTRTVPKPRSPIRLRLRFSLLRLLKLSQNANASLRGRKCEKGSSADLPGQDPLPYLLLLVSLLSHGLWAVWILDAPTEAPPSTDDVMAAVLFGFPSDSTHDAVEFFSHRILCLTYRRFQRFRTCQREKVRRLREMKHRWHTLAPGRPIVFAESNVPSQRCGGRVRGQAEIPIAHSVAKGRWLQLATAEGGVWC